MVSHDNHIDTQIADTQNPMGVNVDRGPVEFEGGVEDCGGESCMKLICGIIQVGGWVERRWWFWSKG